MSSKGHIAATIRVYLPVTLKVDMTAVVDGAQTDIGKAMKRWSKGYKHAAGGDLEDIQILEQTPKDLNDALQEALESEFDVLEFKVTDSR
jgi:hypothetical protein